MKEKVKKGLAYLLSSVLFVSTFATMLPQMALTVNAEGTQKAIQLVNSGNAANIEGAQKSNVYFGTYKQTKNGDGFNVDPIKWRVLSNSGGNLFLLSDRNLDVVQYHTVDEAVTWKESTIRSWLNGYDDSQNIRSFDYRDDNFIGTAFNASERSAISEVEVLNEKNPNYNTPWGDNTKDKVYLLSLSEATNTSYGFTNNYSDTVTRESKNTAYVASGGKTANPNMFKEGENDFWWLRTPGNDAFSAVLSSVLGQVLYEGQYAPFTDCAVRPVINLNLKSVLFTSATESGKSSGTAGADALTAVADYNSNDWKVTLLDDGSTNSVGIGHQGFKAERIDYNAVSAGNAVSIKYSGAQTGTNEFVSAILTDANDNILYYGNIAKCTNSSGEASINIKPGTPDGCKLYVFNEQCNGDKKTDYSSDLIDLTAPKTKPVAKNINLVVNGEADYIEGAQKSNVYFGTYPQSSDGNGGYNVEPIKWRVLSNSNGQLFLLANQGLDCKQYNETNTSITWESSSIRTWLNETTGGFLHDAFVDIERGAIADTLVVNDDNPDYGTKGGNKTTDKIFLLSIAESEDTSFGFTGNDNSTDTRKVISTDYAKNNGAYVSSSNGTSYWWLRSPGVSALNAAYVNNSGYVLRNGDYVTFSFVAIRPALNLNLGSLIFTSAAEGGKSSEVLDGNKLQEVNIIDDTSNVVWNLTLRDTVRNNLSVSRLGSGDVVSGGTVRFSYDNATVGDNEYISAILVDENGDLLSYGKLVKFDSSSDVNGSSYVTLPSNLVEGKTYTLRFISEKCNSSSPTDLASDFDSKRDISFKVGKGTPSADDFIVNLPGGDSNNPPEIIYDGTDKNVNINIREGVTGMGDVKVIYTDSKGNESEDAPKDAGDYTFKLKIADGTNYNGIELTDTNWKFTINPANPQVTDFKFKAPDDLNFNGEEKTATVTKGDEIDLITFKTEYSDENGNKFDEGKYPVEPGTYYVKVIVSEDGNFNSGTLESTEWSFEIKTVDYKVTLNTNGGNIKSNNVTGYTYQTGATLPTASDIEKKGYTFKGWYKDASFTGNPVTEITNKDFGNKDFYAKWEANSYTILFDANADGIEQGTMDKQERIYDDKKELTPNGFSCEGRTFNGWNTDKDGNGTSYSDKEINNIASEGGVAVTLYAQWTINTFTVVWKNYDGTVFETDTNVPYGSIPTYDKTDLPTKPSDEQFTYEFKEWSPAISEVTGPITYIAQYNNTLNKYTVKFVNEDGTELQSNEVEYGAMPSYDGTPTKDNVDNKTYYFTGWDPAISKVTGDATYTAQFGEDEIIYTITFEPNGGSYDVISAITNSQFKLDTIPEPVLEGYKFLGWFSSVDNSKITKDTVFTADTLVYAKWKEITEPGEEEPEETKKIPNYLDELFLKLNIAAELGGKQEVYWNVGDSLPYDVLHFLELHPDITLVFEYTYLDVNYKVTLVGEELLPDPTVPWAGPWYLLGVPKKQKNQ